MEIIDDRSNRLLLENVFSSKGRTKILELLAINGELNISEIIKKTALNHSNAVSHLDALISYNLIQEKHFGRIRIYRFKMENEKARILKKLIDLWECD